MRQNFNIGQEIVSGDLNTLQSRIERGIFDRIIYEMLQRTTNAFFVDGFKAVFQDADTVVLKAGLGFHNVTVNGKEPTKRPLVLDADFNVELNAADAGNPRIDIICVRQNRFNAETENRKVKDEFSDAVVNVPLTVATDWKADVLAIAGVPGVVPAVPATPNGYLKVAEVLVAASTGVASQASITDKRSLLPYCVSTSLTGSAEYDAVVGDAGLGVTHTSLKLALDNALPGWKILVLKDEVIDTTPVVLDDNIEIVFKRGVTFTRGASSIGLQVDANDCKIVNARFKDFITGGDIGIKVSATANRTVLQAPRFKNVPTTQISDLGIQTYTDIAYTE